MLDIPKYHNKGTYENGRTPRRGRKFFSEEPQLLRML
jgi:hypothetical protein